MLNIQKLSSTEKEKKDQNTTDYTQHLGQSNVWISVLLCPFVLWWRYTVSNINLWLLNGKRSNHFWKNAGNYKKKKSWDCSRKVYNLVWTLCLGFLASSVLSHRCSNKSNSWVMIHCCDKCLWETIYREEGFILARGFCGWSPWLLAPWFCKVSPQKGIWWRGSRDLLTAEAEWYIP